MVKQRAHVAIYACSIPESIKVVDRFMLGGMVKQALINYNDFNLTKLTWVDGKDCILLQFNQYTPNPTYPNTFTLTYDGESINFTFSERFHV